MARPAKQGVDYFPLDVHLDNKFKFIEVKFGIEGFGIVVRILQDIYSQGYWINWGEDEQLLFAADNKIDLEKLKAISAECTKRGIFDSKLYEDYKILTSSGIQKRYKEIVRRRKDVTVIAEYTLIDNIDRVNDDIKSAGRKHNVGKSTQSKVKESKEEESKEEDEVIEGPKTKDSSSSSKNPVRYIEENLGFRLSPNQMQETWAFSDDFKGDSDIIIHAANIACDRDRKTFGFVKGRLVEWLQHNLKTLDDVMQYEKHKFGPKEEKKVKSKIPNYEELLEGENA